MYKKGWQRKDNAVPFLLSIASYDNIKTQIRDLAVVSVCLFIAAVVYNYRSLSGISFKDMYYF